MAEIEVGNLRAQISLDDNDTNRTLAELTREVKIAQSEFKRAGTEVEGFGKGTDGLRVKADALTKTINAQQALVNKLRSEHERLAREKGEDAKQTQNMEVRLNRAATELARLQNELRQTNTELEKQTDAWQRISTAVDGFADKTLKIGQQMSTMGKDMSMAVTVPLMAIGGLSMKAADDIDKAMATIVTSTGASGKALEGLRDDLLSVYKEIPASSQAAAGAIANLNTLLGVSGPLLQDITKNILEVSRIMGEDGVSNSHAFGKAMQQWEISAENSASVMDRLFKVTQDTGIGFGELTNQLNTYGPVLKNAGFTIEETAELMGRVNAAGIAWSRISPGLNASFRRWASEGKNLKQELTSVIESIKNAETSTQALTLATETFGAEGAQRLTTAIRQGAFSLEELGVALQGVDGLIEHTAEQTMTLGDRMALFRNRAAAAVEPVGKSLVEAMEGAFNAAQPLLNSVERLATWFSSLDDSTKRMMITFLALTGAIGPLLIIMGKLITSVGQLTKGVKELGNAMRWLVANPYAIGIAALAGAIIQLTSAISSARKATNELRQAQEELQRIQEQGIDRSEIEATEEKIQKLEELKQKYLEVVDAAAGRKVYAKEIDIVVAAENLGYSLKELRKVAREFDVELEFVDRNGKVVSKSIEDIERALRTYTDAVSDARRETTSEINDAARRIASQQQEVSSIERLLKTYLEAKRGSDEWNAAQTELARMFPQFADGVSLNTEAIEGLLIMKRQEIEATRISIQLKAQEILTEKQRELALRESALAEIETGFQLNKVFWESTGAAEQLRGEIRKLKGEIASLEGLVTSPISYEAPIIEAPTTSTSAETSRNTALEEAYRMLEHKKRLDQLTLEEELRTLESIKAAHVKTAEERMAIDERIYAVKKSILSQEMNDEFRMLEHRKRMGQLTVEQEIETLEMIKRNYARSADELMSIEERLYDARQRLAEQHKDKQAEILEEATTRYKNNLEDRLLREQLTDEQVFNARKQMFDNIIRANEEYLSRIMQDERYTADERERIQVQITDVIRNNVNERLRLEQDYYNQVRQQEIDSINNLAQGVQSALRAKYEQEKQIAEQALRDRLAMNDRWRNESINSIRTVYDQRIKMAEEAANKEINEINRVLNDRIKAISDELAALDEAEKQRTRAELDAEDELKLERLRAKMEYEHDEYNKTQLQKEINKILAEQEERHRKEQLEDRKDALKAEQKSLQDKLREETQAIKDQLAEKKAMLQADRDAEIERINNIAEVRKASLNSQLAATQAHYAQLLAARNLQAEAEKMIVQRQQSEILELLESFGDQYKITGQSLGEKLYEGFKQQVDQISELIESVNARIDAVRSAAMAAMTGIVTVSKPETATSSTNTTNVTVQNNFNAPVTTPSAVSRATQQMAQRLALL